MNLARNTSAGITITVPGGLGYVYVRIDGAAGNMLAQALNPSGLSLSADDPIWLDVDLGRRVQRLVIHNERNKS